MYSAFKRFILFLLVMPLSSWTKSVKLSLESSWPHTSLLLEASEFFRREKPDLYWSYVELTSSNQTVCDICADSDDDKCLEQLLDQVVPITSEEIQLLMQMRLSLRYYSPAVETMRSRSGQVDAECYVKIGSDKLYEPADILNFDYRSNNIDDVEVKEGIYHPSASKPSATKAVLHCEPSAMLLKLLEPLKKMSRNGELAVYYEPSFKAPRRQKTLLGGYAVKLQMKSTEYKAKYDYSLGETTDGEQDDALAVVRGFDFDKLQGRFPDAKENLLRFRRHLLKNETSIHQLKPWEIESLSMQVVEAILRSDAKLYTLIEYSHNFLLHLGDLSKITVSDKTERIVQKAATALQATFRDDFFSNMQVSTLYSPKVLINGMVQQSSEIFALFDAVASEIRLIDTLKTAGIQSNLQAHRLLRRIDSDHIPFQSADSLCLDFRNDSVVKWLTDVENDADFRDVPSHLINFVTGRSFFIRRNYFNLVVLVNATKLTRRDAACMTAMSLIKQIIEDNLAVRIGVVVFASADDSIGFLLSEAVHNQQISGRGAFGLLGSVLQRMEEIAEDLKESALTDIIKTDLGNQIYKSIDRSNKLNAVSAFEYFQHTGAGDSPTVFLNDVNLCDERSIGSVDDLLEKFKSELKKQRDRIYSYLVEGKLGEQEDVLSFMFSGQKAKKRINFQLLPGHSHFSMIPSDEHSTKLMQQIAYVFKKNELAGEEPATFPVTLWIAFDPDTDLGIDLLANALMFIRKTEKVRLGLVLNLEKPYSKLARIITASIHSGQAIGATRNFLLKLKSEDDRVKIVENLNGNDENNNGLSLGGFSLRRVSKLLRNQEKMDELMEINRKILTRFFEGLMAGQSAILANGFSISPLTADFLLYDFQVLMSQLSPLSATIADELKSSKRPPQEITDTTMKIFSSLCTRDGVRVSDLKRVNIPYEPAFKVGQDDALIKLDVFLDPASNEGQEMVSFIQFMKHNSFIRVFLVCPTSLSELPITRLYRLSLPDLGSHSEIFSKLNVVFEDVPSTQLFSLDVIPPHSWMIEEVDAVHDLDNIQLSEVGVDVSARFELQHLLVEGECVDASGNRPRGLELVLTRQTPTSQQSHGRHHRRRNVYETTVMANLGYFQLKSYPGQWTLSIRQGRSSDLYSFSKPVAVTSDSLVGKHLELTVIKNPERYHESLLQDDSNPSTEDSDVGQKGFWSSLFSKGSSDSKETKKSAPNATSDDTVNIFSLATGHMYEGLMRIMILSTRRHAKKAPVKYWFLENFLSSTFKKFLPRMAKEYDFEFEFVQYKWPKWLTQYPSEKQRIIWGYKILFLDVLFPLSVKKIIFVDADLVVRADLADLRDIDLKGAPYGYTPFCDSREDMDGYRFWKSGYWASHLGHRKYHISALYVVDLKRFREIAAGDRLRGQYFALSQDRNSLSNLDQDLPNNMIHQVDIFSLPQDWLWCETWCDDVSKISAKAIDLCNNPKTKEHKLQAAMRIIPEWSQYDKEVKQLMKTWHEEMRLSGNSLADANDEEEREEEEEETPIEKPQQQKATHHVHDASSPSVSITDRDISKDDDKAVTSDTRDEL